MNIVISNLSSRVNDVNKTLTNSSTITAKITNDEDVLHPVLELESNHDGDYVEMYDKYYFVTKRENLLNGRIRLYLEEDVLSTWFNNVEIKGVLYKSSENYDLDLQQELPVHVNKILKRVNFDDVKDILGYTLIAQSTYPYTPKPTQ